MTVTVAAQITTPALSGTSVDVCDGQTTDLNTLVTSGTTNLKWYKSDNTEITGTAITQAGAGTYYAKYVSGVCESTATANVTVTSVAPADPAVVAGSTLIPSGSTTTLTATHSNTPAASYEIRWYNANKSQLLHTGNTFTTPQLTAQTTYQVVAAYKTLSECAESTSTLSQQIREDSMGNGSV